MSATLNNERLRELARVICKSRTCEGINCCQWPANRGRTKCPVEMGGYDDAARDVAVHLASPAVVERAARAAYANDHGEDTFDDLRPGLKQHWRNTARAALAAAVGGAGTEDDHA